MPRTFISYRRLDSKKESFELYYHLCDKFGKENVFIDLESLPLGEHFPARLMQSINWADVILLVIGPDWFTAKDKNGNLRLINRFDYVRREVEMALFRYFHQKTPVVPVLVGGASFSGKHLPTEIETLFELSGHQIRPSYFSQDISTLLEKLEQIRVKSGYKANTIQTPSMVDQGVDLTQRIVRFGGLLRPLPEDTEFRLWPVNAGWELAIKCPSNPSENRNRGQISTSEMSGRSAKEAVGVLMEWYDVSSKQCKVWRPRPRRKNLFDKVLGKSSTHDEGDWIQVGRHAAFTSLHKLLIEFDEDVDRYGVGMANIFPKSNTSIIPNYQTYGYFADREARMFGDYVCSITRALGGVDWKTHKLFHCPTVPKTRLQYIDLRQPPDLVEVDYIAHVGKDEKGYHLVYVGY